MVQQPALNMTAPSQQQLDNETQVVNLKQVSGVHVNVYGANSTDMTQSTAFSTEVVEDDLANAIKSSVQVRHYRQKGIRIRRCTFILP